MSEQGETDNTGRKWRDKVPTATDRRTTRINALSTPVGNSRDERR
jgi:hypothetical protein